MATPAVACELESGEIVIDTTTVITGRPIQLPDECES
jgi:hypothetical protein